MRKIFILFLILQYTFSIPAVHYCSLLQIFGKLSQNGLSWKGPLKIILPMLPAVVFILNSSGETSLPQGEPEQYFCHCKRCEQTVTSGKVSCSSWSHLTWRFLLPLRQLSWLTGIYWSISSGHEIASNRQSSNSPKGSFLLHNHSQAYYVKTQEVLQLTATYWRTTR